MPPRIARSSTQQPSSSKIANKKRRKRQLDVFAIAGKLAPEKSGVRSHRLGVAEDEPQAKRRRTDDSENDISDLDEGPSKKRQTSKSKPGDDNDVEYGSDSEGNEWTMGGTIEDDDDESIDSDEAFGESDEERFDGFTFRGSSANKHVKLQQRAAVQEDDFDLSEAESGEEDDFGEDGVDLATMLDDPAESSGSDGSEDDSDAPSPEDSATEDDIDEQDPERNARLQDFVEGLDKKDAPTDPDAEDYRITLDDLLEDADLDTKTLATLKPKRKSKAPEMVKPLLPKRQQDALNREVATVKAKEQLDRWRDTVIQNRRAEFLSFPLKHSDEAAPVARDTFAGAHQNEPVTDLEANLHNIMVESGMLSKSGKDDVEKDLIDAEELAIKDMPVEEVLRRRAELRRHRELLFREEIKAKRIAKIKSKSYRRVHRKERERLAEKERMLLDPEGYANGELGEDEQELADRRRAEARMNAKHKTSKWAKSLRASDRTVWDSEARNSAVDMARRQEELRRRIAGKDVDEEDDDSEHDEDVAVQLKDLRRSDDPATEGLAGLKFMQAAEGRRRKRNEEALAELENELGDHDEEEEIQDEGLGRAIFGPRPSTDKTQSVTPTRPEFQEGDNSDDEVALEVNVMSAPEPAKAPLKAETKIKRGPRSSIKSDLQLNEPQKPEDISEWLSAPRERKSKLDKKLARQDEETMINTDLSALRATDAEVKQTTKHTPASHTASWQEIQQDNSDDEESPMLTQAEQNAVFHARAFAGDDVALSFNNEKDALIASEDEHEVNNSMPGWGAWTGAGLSKSVRKAAQRARHNPLYKTKIPGIRPQDRKDARLDNVIISEKNDRKGRKYLAPMLPHQFERKDDYERSLRMPIGPEWSTKEVFQRNTRPRVVVKPGVIIDPISRPLI